MISLAQNMFNQAERALRALEALQHSTYTRRFWRRPQWHRCVADPAKTL